MKQGFIYVLTHPSDPNLYKIGVTIRDPMVRLAQHNRDFTKAAGRIVEETGQKWELKEYHLVPDPYWAESVFWGNTHLADIPFLGGTEVHKLDWRGIEKALCAAKQAGIRQQVKFLPEHIYFYTAYINKRLQGRSITLLGHVKSIISGKINFRCSNGHEWKARPRIVANGEGCPVCSIGQMDLEQVDQLVGSGVICLLVNPNKTGFIKIGMAFGNLEKIFEKYPWGEWIIHRYRNTDEVILAESLIWELLGKPLPHDQETLKIDLRVAEDAFTKLIYAVNSEIAFEEMRQQFLQY